MASASGAQPEATYFDTQRTLLVNEVAASMETVLQNMNKLNRSLEGVIAVGNEFSQVEGLWSQFESVMSKPPPAQDSESKHAKEGGGAG
ncbi:hypothetical protein LTR08_005006 [Meristemomyces frigidus]|nr:hypothetical protein LTR08_005006 [Meristemomyces frigidus]